MLNISEDFYNLAKEVQLQKGDIVIYTTGAYVGNTQAVVEDIAAIASNHVNILRIKDLDSIFLAFYMNSIPGQLQIKRLVSGAAQAELYPKDIEKIIVPILSKIIQQKISSLIKESFKLRKEYKQLVEETKKNVENLIEGRQLN
jgi:restriction endonuclease S subunit